MIKYSKSANSLSGRGFYRDNLPEIKETNFYEYFFNNNRSYMDEVVLKTADFKFTFSDLRASADGYAGRLAGLGLKSGDTILMLSMPTQEATCLVLACAKLDICVVMLSPAPNDERLNNLIRQENIKFAFISESFIGAAFNMPSLLKNVIIYELPHDKYCPDCFRVNNDYNGAFGFVRRWTEFLSLEEKAVKTAENPVMSLYVAEAPGTDPRGIAYSHGAMIAGAKMLINSQIGFKRGDVYESRIFMNAMACTSLQLLCAMAEGVIINSNPALPFADAKIVPGDLKNNDVNCLIMQYSATFPVLMSGELDDYDFSKLKLVYNFGEYFPPDKMLELHDRMTKQGGSVAVRNCYGLSEGNCILTAEDNVNGLSKSTGYPTPYSRVYIVNPETCEELELGELGEIVYNSPAMMSGYYKDDAATAERLIKDEKGLVFDRTGDLGRMDENGNLYLCGRAGNRIKINGRVIYLDTVKKLFNPDNAFDAVIVVANADNAYVHIKSEQALPAEKLAEQIQRIKANLLEKDVYEKGRYFYKLWSEFPMNHGRVRSDLLINETRDAAEI